MQRTSSVLRMRFEVVRGARVALLAFAAAGCGAIEVNGLADVPDARGEGDGATTNACDVTFTADAEGGRPLVVTGGARALGIWDPTRGVPMTEVRPAVWSAHAPLADGARVEFKFVRRGSSGEPEWESWGAESNRVLDVRCAQGGATAPRAGSPATGTQYEGQFGLRPPEATP